MKLIFRDLNWLLCDEMRKRFQDADIKCANIFDNITADAIISPANCIGRMDGGIDELYVRYFGWQLQARLSHYLIEHHGGKNSIGRYNGDTGRIEIGNATIISTRDRKIPYMIMAPTMDWPPGDVSDTENTYLAFKSALKLAKQFNIKTLLTPGLGTLTGRMPPKEFASQMYRAWLEEI